MQPQLTPEIEAVLRRYIQIQAEELQRREEKAALQATLKRFLDPCTESYTQWLTQVGGQRLKISYRKSVEVEYDEATLRQRLGPRYVEILSPDLQKLKQELPTLAEALAPVLDRIGTPDPVKVRRAIESGRLTKDDFRGAFRKVPRDSFAVARQRDDVPGEAQ